MTKQKPILNQEDIKLLKSIFATKGDLVSMEERFDQKFATKGDLSLLEHRFDLKLASKDDLKNMEKKLITFVENESAINMEILMKYFDRAGLDTHDKRIKALEMEIGITTVFN